MVHKRKAADRKTRIAHAAEAHAAKRAGIDPPTSSELRDGKAPRAVPKALDMTVGGGDASSSSEFRDGAARQAVPALERKAAGRKIRIAHAADAHAAKRAGIDPPTSSELRDGKAPRVVLRARDVTVGGGDPCTSPEIPGGRVRQIAPTLNKATSSLGALTTLQSFLATTGELTEAEHRMVVEQAIVLIDGLYVHLPLKRARHAVDPVQRLKLLLHRLKGLSERGFQDEMISIFTELRDLHTNYLLPDPYRSKTAFLPFLLEEFFENGDARYMVSKVFKDLVHPMFQPGVVVTHWNGIPIGRAVDLNAERNAGSNEAARHARGLERLTIRPMLMSSLPDEEWVDVRYVSGGKNLEVRVEWNIFEPSPAPGGVDPSAARRESARRLGIDVTAEVARRAKKMLFNKDAMDSEGKAATAAVDLATQSTMPDVLSFRPVTTPSGTFGYIRIWTFDVEDVDGFLNEVIRILDLLPDNGLILDVRGNGGGIITAGESMLQLFTPRSIQPELLHFINTPLTLELTGSSASLKSWTDSISEAVETGAEFSQGFALEPSEAYNSRGQRYTGPVILITDALSYSTTDIFAAGFQDHNIGPILGTAANTGAGGANVWTLELLRKIMPGKDSPFRHMPSHTSFRVAVRRTTRVGPRAGMPLEDLGVVPNRVHPMTWNDLLHGNIDLICEAGKELAQLPVRRISPQVSRTAGKVQVTVDTANIDRLDVLVDGRPQLSLDVTGGTSDFELAGPAASAKTLELRGFDAGQLVASRRLDL
jgi:hypothetical protein